MDQNDDKSLELYPAHLHTLRQRYDAALESSSHEAAVIGSGVETYRFQDDLRYPFSPNPTFVQWLPLAAHPESCLIYQPGQPIRLIIYEPDDFWHKPPPLPGPLWRQHFELSVVTSPDRLARCLDNLPSRTALIGEPTQWRHNPPEPQLNPPDLLNELNYWRSIKTDYEIECIRMANSLAVPAHRAAAAAFHSGASEYEILLTFLKACGQTENELPYPAIIAGNENGATLHYQHYVRQPGMLHSLLIDAACGFNGYASDITRTHVRQEQDESDGEFAAMVADLEEMQQKICSEVRPGISFASLHQRTHELLAGLLSHWQLVCRSPDELVGTNITGKFFPHGLGHFLGLQVHDVAGSMAGPDGSEIPPPADYPHLRLRRTLEAGQVLTIEPGVYFIDSLLQSLRNSPLATDVDWKKIQRLTKFGGIRIEDNVVVTDSGMNNITRQAFSASSR